MKRVTYIVYICLLLLGILCAVYKVYTYPYKHISEKSVPGALNDKNRDDQKKASALHNYLNLAEISQGDLEDNWFIEALLYRGVPKLAFADRQSSELLTTHYLNSGQKQDAPRLGRWVEHRLMFTQNLPVKAPVAWKIRFSQGSLLLLRTKDF